MGLKSIRILAIAMFLSATASEARSQVGYAYGPGYGAYGWGGWGRTVGGDMARGLGYFNRAAGVYNRQTAIANAINVNTIMRWNQYLYLSQLEANRRYALRHDREVERSKQLGDEIQDRLLNHPTAGDIEGGNALNAILDQITDPQVHPSTLRLATNPIGAKAIREIPFFLAPQAATISLDKLTVEDGWPAALRGPDFAPARQAYRKAVETAIGEAVDREEPISAPTLREMRDALVRMRAGLKATPPKDQIEAANARDYLRGLTGMTRLLDRPRIEAILAELDTIDQTSLGSLLGFMQSYNLRFGRATTPRQRQAYREIYPSLVSLRDRVMGEGEKGRRAIPAEAGRPLDFFGGMELDEGVDATGSAH